MSYGDNTPVNQSGASGYGPGRGTVIPSKAQQGQYASTPQGQAAAAAAKKENAVYGKPIFKNNQWHVTKNGKDMVFDPNLYQAGKGYLPLGYKAPAAAKPVAAKPAVQTAAQKAAAAAAAKKAAAAAAAKKTAAAKAAQAKVDAAKRVVR
jgi:hypothetical protein